MLLITGATGNNGLAVLRELDRHGSPARALVRDPGKAAALKDLAHVTIVEGDLLRPDSLGRALDGVERALLISSASPAMLETQCTFIDAARSAGVRHIVKFSGAESGLGFRAEKFRFTRIHEQVERYLESSGLAWTHLRPSQFMQVYLREVPAIVATGRLSLPAGDIALAPVDIEDIAKVAFHLLTTSGHEGKRYEMTGPEALTMSELAASWSAIAGRPISYVHVSPEEKRDANVRAGMSPEIADALYDQAVERLQHPTSRVLLDTHAQFRVEPTTFAGFARRHKRLFS